MNRNELFENLSTVDKWSQLSCLGSMQYVVTADAIQRAVRLLPKDPTPDTVEAFLNEERNMRIDIKTLGNTLGDGSMRGAMVKVITEADVSSTPGNYKEARDQLAALLDLRAELIARSTALTADLDRDDELEERTLSNTLQFMISQNRIDPVRYARQYTTNMRLGMKNYGQTRAQFVEQETKRAAEAHAQLVAKGEIAVQFLEGIEPREGEISERLMDTLQTRCVSKLLARRIKLGQSLSWRTEAEDRMNIITDIEFIEAAVKELGGDVPAEVMEAMDVPEPVEVATSPEFEAFKTWQAAQTKFDPKKPGVVSITH